jgi:hypothetical protein
VKQSNGSNNNYFNLQTERLLQSITESVKGIKSKAIPVTGREGP